MRTGALASLTGAIEPPTDTSRTRGSGACLAEDVILNDTGLWTKISSDQKARLQKELFPEGVTFANGEFETTVLCLLFKLLKKPEGEKSILATPPGIEPGSQV